jgi:hypothetical protein
MLLLLLLVLVGTATTTVVLGPVKVHHLCTGSGRPTLHAPHPIAAVHKQDLWQQTYQVDSSGSVDGATELATELAMALAPAVTEGSSRQQQSPNMHFDFCCSVYVLCQRHGACCHQIKPLSGMKIIIVTMGVLHCSLLSPIVTPQPTCVLRRPFSV